MGSGERLYALKNNFYKCRIFFEQFKINAHVDIYISKLLFMFNM